MILLVILSDTGHKKARRAYAVRAFRTSSVDSGDRRWRILVELAGVEPASEISTSSACTLGFANPVESRISPNSVELSIPDFTSWIPARNANLLNSTISAQNQRPAFFMIRALSSCHSRSLRSVRLSCCFLPFATPIFTLHQAFFQYIESATTVKPSRLMRP